jgi:hypothetical protein
MTTSGQDKFRQDNKDDNQIETSNKLSRDIHPEKVGPFALARVGRNSFVSCQQVATPLIEPPSPSPSPSGHP